MGFGERVAQSEVKNQNSGWLPEGVYPVVQIDTLKYHDKKDLFIAELDILESKDGLAAGNSASICIDCGKFDGAFIGDVKAFLAAASGESPEEIDGAGVDAAVSDVQPMQGMALRVTAIDKAAKTTGRTFTKYAFSAVSDEIKDSIDNIRAEAGFTN